MKTRLRKAICVLQAMMIVSMSFAFLLSTDAKALDFVDTASIDVPWSSSFTPLDTAWDSTGTQCVVVGNETSSIDSSAWLYNEPSDTWYPIHEGSDPTIQAVHLVENHDTHVMYGTIQSAINAATVGDTLNVWAGTYHENIRVNKTLTLIGNGSANTVINGDNLNTAVAITANGVTLKGFNVTGGAAQTGILLFNVQNCRIENNTIIGNTDGISITGSSNNIIKNNYLKNNAAVGVRVQSSSVTKTLVGFTESGGDSSNGGMFKIAPSGDNYSFIHSFGYGYTDGLNPYFTKFIQDIYDSNILYGMTNSGGFYNRGTVFRINKDGSNHMLLHEFRYGTSDGYYPFSSLTQIGSVLFGMTPNGGTYNYGTIFRINTDGSGYSIIHNFTSSAGRPYCSLTQVGVQLYGLTTTGGASGYGVMFRINQDGSGFTTLLSFTGTIGPYYGSDFYASLLLDSNTGTVLYGAARTGGTITYNSGCLFKVNLDGSGYKNMLNFTNNVGPNYGRYPFGTLLQSANTLYGTTYLGGNGNGVLFRINTDSTNYRCLYNFTAATGYQPYSSLIQDANYVYGMTSTGGAGYGTVFSFHKFSSTYLMLHSFTGPDGMNPYGALVYDGATLYGMTQYGGVFNSGIVFKMSTDGLMYQVIHQFDRTITDGRYPYGMPVQGGQYLFGASGSGGINNLGSIFRTNLDGGDFTLLHSFSGGVADGSYPYSSPILESGVLYGTTCSGGTDDNGVLFRMNMDGTGFTLLHEFINDGTDGYYPSSPPMLIGGYLYGSTESGGIGGQGTIYRIDTIGNNYLVMYNFMGSPTGGSNPNGGLVSDGIYLYGTTQNGGAFGGGSIFSAAIDGSALVTLHSFSFSSSDGRDPYGKLALGGTTLFGITNQGGINDQGAVFRIDITGSGFTLLRSLSSTDGIYPTAGVSMDGSMLYAMATDGGAYNCGTVFRLNTDTLAFSVLHDFGSQPNDAAYPYMNDLGFITLAGQTSADNIIYHNNFIDNTMHALNDDLPANYWCDVYPICGNYWDDYVGVDADSDGIGDSLYTIPDVAGAADSYPAMVLDGWAMPYATFRSVVWDNVNQRFWMCGEYSANARSTLYYITAAFPTVMVPIMAPPITFTALAADELGNVLIGANDQMAIFYYDARRDSGYSVVENNTGGMYGWNITGITFNPYDNRFYVVGNVENMDRGVAFVTDQLPLNQSGKKCYLDSSDFMNTPGIGGLKSIAWNPVRNYSIAVGDGVYRLNPYNGNLARQLSWSTVKAPQAGTSYSDISWDTNGWNEAGITGKVGSFGTYWRYYYSNPELLQGYSDTVSGTRYMTCAMKPPSSPKWLFIPASGGGIRINIVEKDESGTVSFNSDIPQIFSVNVWKQSDVLRPSLMNSQVDVDSTYTFFIEGNYTVGGIDFWSSLTIGFTAWYDGGNVGLASAPGDPTWANPNFRTRQFNLTYTQLTGASMVYPLPVGIPPVREFYVSNYWEDPTPHGTDGNTHYLFINITFEKQTFAANGGGFINGAATGSATWSKNSALNDPGSWDMRVHMYDTGNTALYNLSYEEFGTKQFASIMSSGSASGSAPPGTNNYFLGDTAIHYSTNTQHFVTVSIPDLHMNGDPLNPKFIPTTNIHVASYHSLAPGFSDIESDTLFSGPNIPLCIWGVGPGPGTPIPAPLHGTEASGPMYSNYTAAAMALPFEVTEFGWWVNVPVSISAGVYRGTITITITDTL